MASSSNIKKLKFTLNNGIEMPAVGFGTFRIRTLNDIATVLDRALEAGYRMFDTAAVYGNEKYIGDTLPALLKKYKLKREDIFITTKLSPSDHGGGTKTENGFATCLGNLGMEYVDLFLIHWPGTSGLTVENNKNIELRRLTWQAMVKIYNSGRAKAIGVSNYTVRHLTEMENENFGVTPAVNQVEWHPYYYQNELKEYCTKNKIILQAYCSLGGTSSRDKSLLEDPIILKISQKYKVTPSQILLKWPLHYNIAIIPKASSELHIRQNIELDFEIEQCDLNEINMLNKQIKYAWNPDTVV